MKASSAEVKIIDAVLLAAVLPWLVSLAASFRFGATAHVQMQLHESLELAGSCMALMVAMLLWLRVCHEKETEHLLWVTASLVAMGMVDGAHALVPFGIPWSWMRHSATLIGGLFFGLIWLPLPALVVRNKKFFLSSVIVLAGTVVVSICVWSKLLPPPWGPAGYSFPVKLANAVGGTGFMVGALFFLGRHRRNSHPEELMFASQGLLFGAASLLFGYCHVWDATWWVWHGLRLLAYVTVLLAAYHLVVKLYQQIASDAQELEAHTAESRRLAAIVTCSNEAIIGKSLDGTVTTWNPAAELVYGYAADEMIGRNISRVIPPDRVEEFHNMLGRIRRGEEVRGYDSVRIRKDGQRIYVSLAVAPIRDSSGKLVGASTIARDITEQKRAEKALRAERQRFSSVLDRLPVYVVLLTPDYHVAFDNVLFRERFGESQGRRCYEYLFGRSEPCEICETYNTLKSNVPQRWKWTGPDGRHYDIFDFPFADTDGSPLILEMGLDITEQERAQSEVRRLNDELEQRVKQRTAELEAANKELEAFTYSVSHDLRAPLRHISGFSKILAEEFGAAIPPEAQHHLQRIADATRRMGQLVDDLLNLGRVGRHELRLQVTGLNTVVNEVIADLKPECEGRDITWNVGRLPYMDCDPALMKQVFQNLLSNAVKFTRPRAHAVIEVGQVEQGGVSAVFVRDNGVGFSMKYVDKLFGVFQRLHRPEDFEGTGVGLATVQRIIHKHGGRIWAEAELDKGATFYFMLGTCERTEAKTKAMSAGDGE